MTMHELIDPPEEKSLPDVEDKGVRVPLSLGNPREDHDKEGNHCRVYDVIWHPEPVKNALQDKQYQMMMVQLAFHYIEQKHKHKLNQNYLVPKMRYKGKNIEWQRVRAKKAPTIQEVGRETLSPEEQKKQEEMIQSRANEMIKKNATKAALETPTWKLLVFNQNSNASVADQWHDYKEGRQSSFAVFNGCNLFSDQTLGFAIESQLPLLVRGVAIELRVTKLFLYLRVNPLYELKLCLPRIAEVDSEIEISSELKLKVEGLFDCKDRKCLVFFPVEKKEKECSKADQKQTEENQGERGEEKEEVEDVEAELFGAI